MDIIKFKFRDLEGMLIKKNKGSFMKYIYLKCGREVDSLQLVLTEWERGRVIKMVDG